MEIKEGRSEIKVYKYRWIILFVYGIYTAVNYAQYLEYSIISNIIAKYYDAKSVMVDLSGLMFTIIYVLAFIPANYFIERYNLRYTSITAIGLTTSGSVLKLFSVSPNRFYLVLTGQGLCAVGQVLSVPLPSKVACTWFGAQEVSTACAVGVLFSQLGVAIGCFFPVMMVKKSEVVSEIEEGLFKMLLCYAIVTIIIFILTVALFKAKPDLPPSISQLNLLENDEKYTNFFQSVKQLVSNKDFYIIMLSYGIGGGILITFGILFSALYLHYFPGSEEEAGIIALAAIISGGCIASIILGYILDKTHKFKLTAFMVLFLAGLAFAVVTVVLEIRWKVASYIAIPIFGFFISTTLVVAYEYTLEVTYPVPEEAACSIIIGVIYLVSLILTFTGQVLFESELFFETNIAVSVILFISSFAVLFVSPKLRRLEANQSKK